MEKSPKRGMEWEKVPKNPWKGKTRALNMTPKTKQMRKLKKMRGLSWEKVRDPESCSEEDDDLMTDLSETTSSAPSDTAETAMSDAEEPGKHAGKYAQKILDNGLNINMRGAAWGHWAKRD